MPVLGLWSRIFNFAHCCETTILITLATLLLPGIATAAQIDDLQAELKRFDQTYKENAGALSNADINQAIKDLAGLKNKVDDNLVEQQSQIQNLKNQLQSLGEPSDADSKEVREKRNSLQKQLEKNEALSAQYKLFSIQIEDHQKTYHELRQTLFKKRLLNRGPAITELLRPVLVEGGNPFVLVTEIITQHHGLNAFTLYDGVALLIWLLIASAISIWSRKKLIAWASSQQWKSQPLDQFLEALVITFARYFPRLLISLVLAVFVHNIVPDDKSYSFIKVFTTALPVYFVLRFVAELILLPKRPARRVLQIDDDVARKLLRWSRLFINVLFVAAVVMAAIYEQAPGEKAVLFAQDLAAIILIPLALKLLLVAAKIRQLAKYNTARIAVMFLMTVSLVVQLLGYRNLTFQTLRIVLSLILLYLALRYLVRRAE